MGRIVILDENTSNQIAAGEVVERPASVVKELVENSIDAGSTSVSVEINNGGVSLIKVVDNGSGIEDDDVEIAFERHATSKIRNSGDLESISTLGFRGEALASIASVSTVEITTRIRENSYGRYVKVQGGVLKDSNRTGCPVGTTIIVRELFYNTPARYKFLKKDTTEAGYISDIVSRIALGNPHISMRFVNNRNNVLHTPGNNDLLSTIFSLYGKDTAKECLKVLYEDEKIKITGYAGKPEIARSNRNHQSIYINGRYVKNKIISAAIDEAYKTFLLKNKFAFIVLNIEVNPMLVDVNVHPTKMEVRFSGEQDIFRAVYHAVNNALLSKPLIRNIELSEKPKNYFKFESVENKKDDYVQQGIHTPFERMPASKTRPDMEKVREEEKVVFKDIERQEEAKNESLKTLINKGSLYLKEEVDNGTAGKADIKPDAFKNKDEGSGEITKKVYDSVNIDSHEMDTQEASRNKPLLEDTSVEETLSCNKENCNKENVNENETKDILINSRIIGQVFLTYILLQNEENLIIIDQHAAHERIKFESLKKKYQNSESIAQFLLTSEVVELTNREISFIEEEKDFLGRLGFIFENFGSSSVILRSVPLNCENTGVKDIFLEIIDLLMSNEKRDNKTYEDEVLYQIACKSAVKANKRLDEMEIKNMLKELMEIDNPYTCPHGRPTIIKITKYEFEKMFKRII